ncbi:MAG: HlyD family efflux transporter periplasmic adaptor subunit [Pseudomonadota bacterium]
MKIIREKPCQRLHHRVTAPLEVTMPDGELLIATNWSLGGIRLDNLRQSLPTPGTRLPLLLKLPFQGFDISFDVEVEIVRTVGSSGTIGAKFVDLGEREHDLMSHFIEDLIRGKMATIDDTICRIDVPVTPISTKPDVNPASEVPKKRWPIKTIAMSVFYVVLGISVFSYLAILIHTGISRMEITSAVVSAPLLQITMPVDGRIVPVALAEDTWVTKGQRLARVVNPQADAKLMDLRFRQEKERRDLMRSQERLRIEKSRMELYQVVNQTELQSARARVVAARENLSAADARHERISALRDKGLVRKDAADLVTHQLSEAENRLREAELELEKLASLYSVSGRKHFSSNRFVADLDLLALEVEEAHSRLSITNMRLAQLEEVRSGLDITAPVDGRIVSVSVPDETLSLRGHRIATLEKRIAPEVTAFLAQDEVIHVGMDDEATVFLPSLSKRFSARVRRINRSSGALRPDASHYVWKDGGQKSAAVELAMDIADTEREMIRGGLPAIVVFSKRSRSSIYADLVHAFSQREL